MQPIKATCLSLLCLCLAPIATAGEPDGGYARMVVIDPKPGMEQAFADGYRRHLQWHEANRDPWTWYGWTFVLGERMGQFMDGTFGHRAEAFDHAVKPGEDAADNNRNVVPYADFLSHGVYARLDRLSTGKTLPDTSAFLLLDTYSVAPGNEARFEQAAGSLKAADAADASWFKLVVGGSKAQYVLMRRAASFAEGVQAPEPAFPAGVVESHQSELLRFQRDMSYLPAGSPAASK